MTSAQIQICLLGPPRLVDAQGNQVTGIPKKGIALLAYLRLAEGRAVTREELARLFWPDVEVAQGRSSLRTGLAKLRTVLDRMSLGGLQTTARAVTLSLPEGVVDLDAVDALEESGPDTVARIDTLNRGPFLAGMKLRSRRFEEWCWIERQRLNDRLVGMLLAVIEDDAHPARRQAAETVLRIEPTCEPAYRCLMQLERDAGAPDAALRWFQRCEERLRRDLDAAPSYATRLLAGQIRSGKLGAPPQKRVFVAFVAVAGLVWPQGREVDPEYLLAAQDAFVGQLSQLVKPLGGQVFAGLAGQILVIFEAEAAEEKRDALRGVFQSCAQLVIGVDDHTILKARLGLARGTVAQVGETVAGTAVNDAIHGCGLARPDEIRVANSALSFMGL